jgi:LPXTG-motif cell wall-anchored protein
LIVNDSGNYTVALTIITSCRDTIPPVFFRGHYSVSEGKTPSTGSATTKGILIGVLLLLFLALRRKTEKFRKKTGGYQ